MAGFEDAECRETECDIAIIGGGAGGLVAALRGAEAGAQVVVFERDAIPRGSTSLWAGLTPDAGTRFQLEDGIDDSPDNFAADILAKSGNEAHPEQVRTLTKAIGPAVEWLADKHGLPFSVVDNFTYPGHSALRMHGLPTRSGAELMDALRAAVERADVDIVTNARACAIEVGNSGLIRSVMIERPDGSRERIGCRAAILACNGYGGNKQLVGKFIPEIANALYFGHPGNQGEAVLWGEALGAELRHMSGYQGHGSVAHPHATLITWATMMEGGFQVNMSGQRFSDESHGYSEQTVNVLRQEGGIAWSVFDERIAAIARQFEDFRNAEAHGAILRAATVAELARSTGMPAAALEATFASVQHLKQSAAVDQFGRSWAKAADLTAPFCAVRVTGALFHTQGGLAVDETARVLRKSGAPFDNLYAVGGAACGVSGSKASGYLSGNGLLSAVGFGFIAGKAAASDLEKWSAT